ncbi:hypothetical protein ACP70R_043185 [Stipagrostis hirtigluma subsp. patula]
MASSPARRPPVPVVLLLLVLFLGMLSSPSVCAASESRRVDAPALPPAERQEFQVAPAPVAPRTGRHGGGGGVPKDGEARRPVRGWRRSRGRGGGTGAWAFSAMLPRGYVPPSGSSACHNDMPATAVDAQFFACSGAETP